MTVAAQSNTLNPSFHPFPPPSLFVTAATGEKIRATANHRRQRGRSHADAAAEDGTGAAGQRRRCRVPPHRQAAHVLTPAVVC